MLDLVNWFVTYLKKARYLYIKIAVYGVKNYDYGNTSIGIPIGNKGNFEAFCEKLYVCKEVYYSLVIFFWLVNFQIIEQLLEDWINNSLTNMRVDGLKFCIYYLRVINIYNIVEKIII